MDQLALGDDLFALAPERSDAETYTVVIKVWRGGEVRCLEIEGDLRCDPAARAAAPGPLAALFDRLASFDHPRAQPWRPDRIEVILTHPLDEDECIPWPEGWPDLDDPSTEGNTDTFYKVIVDGAHLSEVQAMVDEDMPVFISGVLLDIDLRFPIPNERAIKDAGTPCK